MSTDWSDKIILSNLTDEPALSDELASLADRLSSTERSDMPHVVLDFSAVTYINSSNIAQLLKLRNLLKAAGRELRICGVTDEVWSVLLVTGLDRVFKFEPDTLTALAGLQMIDEQE
ncbi:MAG: anti-sigma factor antagonist [Planctomycetota bacterium]|nr:MAG: anti-sigma factor antagonist [Planctomycetota bacterium]